MEEPTSASLPPPQPPPPRRAKRWRPELLFSIASLLVSMCAFGAAAMQTYLMQRQQHATVWPYLELGISITGNEGFSVQLTNKGVGPAIIKEVDLSYQGRRYDRLEKIARLIVKDSAFDYRIFSTSPPDNKVFAQGESRVIFNVRQPAYAARLIQATDQVHIRIRYASVFGQEWMLEDGQTRKVE
ncbi:MAG: hypothetical protein MUC97_10475 [Bernardetiaceae bacterium]|jgi:hypothetical protein|nr:hypothetical protein [Bernardetiaceae bacterium]